MCYALGIIGLGSDGGVQKRHFRDRAHFQDRNVQVVIVMGSLEIDLMVLPNSKHNKREGTYKYEANNLRNLGYPRGTTFGFSKMEIAVLMPTMTTTF